jgi:hypothetical protein
VKLDPQAVVRVDEVMRYLDSDCFMPKKPAAEFCGVSVRTLEGWPLTKYRPGGKCLYRKSELVRFMEAHRELPTEVDLNIDRIANEVVRSVLQ